MPTPIPALCLASRGPWRRTSPAGPDPSPNWAQTLEHVTFRCRGNGEGVVTKSCPGHGRAFLT